MSKRSPVGGAREQPPTGRAGSRGSAGRGSSRRGAPYQHVQRGRLHWTLHAFLPLLLALPLASAEGQHVPWLAVGTMAVLLELIACCVMWLGAYEREDHLLVRFGPLPLFRTRVPFASITAVERDSFTFFDGWGLHWRLMRGWCWRVGGRDCVHVTAGRRQLRIGTDDPEGLAAVLRERAGL